MSKRDIKINISADADLAAMNRASMEAAKMAKEIGREQRNYAALEEIMTNAERVQSV